MPLVYIAVGALLVAGGLYFLYRKYVASKVAAVEAEVAPVLASLRNAL